jgi:hypothetical protein
MEAVEGGGGGELWRRWKVGAVASYGGGVTCEALDDGGAAAGADLFESVGRKERKRNVKYHTSHVTRHTCHLEFNSATSEASAASIITVTLDTVLLHS